MKNSSYSRSLLTTCNKMSFVYPCKFYCFQPKEEYIFNKQYRVSMLSLYVFTKFHKNLYSSFCSNQPPLFEDEWIIKLSHLLLYSTFWWWFVKRWSFWKICFEYFLSSFFYLKQFSTSFFTSDWFVLLSKCRSEIHLAFIMAIFLVPHILSIEKNMSCSFHHR